MQILKKKYIRTIFAWMIVLIVAYFFTNTLIDNWDQLKDVNLEFNALTVVGMVLFAGTVVWSGELWGRMLGQLSHKPVATEEAVRVQTLSWLLKYIPGQAGSFLNKIAWAQEHGYDKKLITITFIYEHAFLVFASVLLSVPILVTLFYEQVSNNLSIFLPILLAIPLLALLNQRIFYTVLNKMFKLLKRQPIEKKYILSSNQLVVYTLRFLGPRLINGIGFLFVVASITQIPSDAYLGLLAAYILAGAIGLLAIFVPSGIGVREAVIVLFASQYFSVEVAIVISIVARLYATLADGLVALIYLYLTRRKKKKV